MRNTLRATYRVQFTGSFTFSDAEALVPYWRDLGVSHLYASPISAARTGSQHGYDVVDPALINPELGGKEAFLRLANALKANGLGLIIDIVPNHMGIGDPRNTAWLDALEFGPHGFAGSTFDIDWQSGPVLIPFLGETLDRALEAGDLKPFVDPQTPRIGLRYYDHILPFRPETTAEILAAAHAREPNLLLESEQTWVSLETHSDADTIAQRRGSFAERLASADAGRAIEAEIARKLRIAGEDHAAAKALFDRQHWRLANWHLAKDEINYRRFFNISDLVSLQAERPEVFAMTHKLPLRLVSEGLVDGLRVDHVDGLSDPAAYCKALRQAAGEKVTIHVEKILDRDEKLRPWPIEGTTGYELLNLVSNLFIDPNGYRTLADHARKTDMLDGTVDQRVSKAKRKILTESFVAELVKLSRVAKVIADENLATRDFSLEAIRRALSDIIVLFPIYRSYLTAGPAEQEDIKLIEDVCRRASDRSDSWERSVVGFLKTILLSADKAPAVIEMKRRFQQLTAPVMAKGYEDTELYRHIVLLSANEVGGHIAAPSIDAPTFHRRAIEQQTCWPNALLPLATHDTKRGAGARARINAISECADAWLQAVALWSDLNHPFKTEIGGSLVPDPLDEELIYQTMLGSWPVNSERLLQYLSKAIREAKRRTSWENPDAAYEEAIACFAKALLDDDAAAAFRDSFDEFTRPLIEAGRLNAYAQTVVQFTFPAVPDVYWGTEFWDLSMVDPDNRRPVDWAARREALNSPFYPVAIRDVADDKVGSSKLTLIKSLLDFRAKYPALFSEGPYVPLNVIDTEGKWLAYARGTPECGLIVVVSLRGMTLLQEGIGPDPVLELPEAWCVPGKDILSGSDVALKSGVGLSELLKAASCAVVGVGLG